MKSQKYKSKHSLQLTITHCNNIEDKQEPVKENHHKKPGISFNKYVFFSDGKKTLLEPPNCSIENNKYFNNRINYIDSIMSEIDEALDRINENELEYTNKYGALDYGDNNGN